MALIAPCKTALWGALRALRRGDSVEAVKLIQDALIYLELDRASIDPSLRLPR